MKPGKGILMCVAVILSAPWAAGASQSAPKPAANRSFVGEIWDAPCAKQGTHEKMAQQAKIPAGSDQARQCTIVCHQMGSALVLYDPHTRRTYRLDDQEAAAKFAGQRVRVEGQLDPKTHILHVAKIEPR